MLVRLTTLLVFSFLCYPRWGLPRYINDILIYALSHAFTSSLLNQPPAQHHLSRVRPILLRELPLHQWGETRRQGIPLIVCMYMYVCMVMTYSKRMDQPGKVTNPVRGQLNRENEYFPVRVRASELGLARRFGSPVPRQIAHLHTQVECGAYLRDFSRVPQRRPFICLKPPYAIGPVPSLSGHTIAYR